MSDELMKPRTCCKCGQVKTGVRTIGFLSHPCAISGHGWGCVVCGAPPNGAMVAVCDTCAESDGELTLAYRGRFDDGTEPIAETRARGKFRHDLSKHPEARRLFRIDCDCGETHHYSAQSVEQAVFMHEQINDPVDCVVYPNDVEQVPDEEELTVLQDGGGSVTKAAIDWATEKEGLVSTTAGY